MDYILRISGDFEKGDCMRCPCGILSPGGFICGIDIENAIACPLEEATVAKNATVEGEWIFSEWGHPDRTLTCNKCGYRYEGMDYTAKANHTLHNFCPNCGKPMKGGAECVKLANCLE